MTSMKTLKKRFGSALPAGLFLLIFLLGTPLWAQDEAYRIGPGDVLSVAIYAGGEKQQEVFLTPSAGGEVNVPFVGPVQAVGLTVTELENRIFAPLESDYFVDPSVNVHITEYHSLRYYISGAVNAPGLYEMRSRATLMKLIVKAGGVVSNRGNVAYILRDATEAVQNGENVEALVSLKARNRSDLNRLLDQGDMAQDISLESGDVVYIPFEKEQHIGESNIYVEGEVRKPGVYAFQPGLTALNACIVAGGFGKYAAPNRTRIIRKENNRQKIIKINLEKVRDGKTPDVALKPGDRINVPESWL
ncbi:polysaccharide export protein [Desulfonema ishimotonii]|uniref:Polysaccharide export protein n=1 Tax=Desulfonema ishimotonii TaxID=45657 RepID=A0A401FZ27_9BACT|nr:polysaccharide biosynthesis/export family protein [Desulfonema ishimotonii]GBC62231.1 polysaccharide export protein [Desulfonema ishimotonii]